MASGGVSLAAGVVIALDWPADSLWVLGLIMAVDLLLQGISLVMTGLALRPGKGQ